MRAGIREEKLHKISQNVLCLCRNIEDLYDQLDRRKAKRFTDLEPNTNQIVQRKHEAILNMRRTIKEAVPSSNVFEKTIRYTYKGENRLMFCHANMFSAAYSTKHQPLKSMGDCRRF